MPEPTYEFYTRLSRTINSGQTRSLVLCGNIYDLFWNGKEYVPLIPYLLDKTKPVANCIQVVAELNGPIRFGSEEQKKKFKDVWVQWQLGGDWVSIIKGLNKPENLQRQQTVEAEFDAKLREAIGNPNYALEFLRQMCVMSREVLKDQGRLLIFIEGGDMMLPAGNGDLAALNDGQVRRIAIVQDWFSEPAFVQGRDTVVVIAESRSMIHPRISKMPQIVSTEVPSPGQNERRHYIDRFVAEKNMGDDWKVDAETLARSTAGLSIYALRQLLLEACYLKKSPSPQDVIEKVEDFIKSQVGDDVVEFSKPIHRLVDVVGCRKVKKFIVDELIPRMKQGTLTGCAVAGSIGSGKTFLFEAVASELDMPVLVLKNLRSQWFGQTDVIFERLRRALEALGQLVIFIDEADTQFGGVGENTHETERRLTGKVQAMMSDNRLRGKIIWILMTARIHLLSPDVRRPGRAGDLIVPIFDPEGEDRKDFIRWVLAAFEKDEAALGRHIAYLDSKLQRNYSAAAFGSLRQHLKANYRGNPDTLAALVEDIIPADIGLTREYQELQALINCTRRSLLPDGVTPENDREKWQRRLRELEAMGIR